MNFHFPATRIEVDALVSEANPDGYDGLLIPGGFNNPDLLRQSAAARDFVRAFAASQKPIVTLCHGPWLLASAGLLEGRTLTSWPGIRDDLVNAGATCSKPSIRSPTSTAPTTLMPGTAGYIDGWRHPGSRRWSDPRPPGTCVWSVSMICLVRCGAPTGVGSCRDSRGDCRHTGLAGASDPVSAMTRFYLYGDIC